tara:strand:- start:53 stop:172 length:120 start_codon:yes stop_codon:yes gene_type:complete
MLLVRAGSQGNNMSDIGIAKWYLRKAASAKDRGISNEDI